MKDSFSRFHPLVNFGYFTAVLLFSMFVMNPVFLIIAIVNAVWYSAYLNGGKSLRFAFLYVLPLAAMLIVINPLFNHEGATILTYLPNGNPLTLESIVYGVMAGLLMAVVVMWFSCFNKVMTADKFMYLFSKAIPHLSLMLSMSLRFVPRFKEQFAEVRKAQQCIGRDISSGSIIRRIKNAVRIFGIMISRALEGSVETADSMRSRGYGTTKRTCFTKYTFEKRDGVILTLTAAFSGYVIFGCVMGYADFRCFPTVSISPVTAWSLTVYVCYFALCSMPMIINLREDRKWKYLRSKI